MATEGFKFFHAADLHIDSPLRGLERYDEAPMEEIRSATRRAFENLVRRAIEESVAFVILAGDVFDGDWKDFGTGLWFAARLRELTNEGIRVYIVAGNHDAQGKMTMSLTYPEAVRTFRTSAPESFVDEPTGVVLHGQSFAKAATTEDLASNYPASQAGAFNIGVLHTALTGREGHDPYAPCSPDSLRGKGYDYWALGHVHEREIVSEEPWIVFPGNLQARHIRETGAKGATLVTVADGRITSVTAEVFDVVRFARLEVDVGSCVSRSECEDAVAAKLADARNEADGRLLAARVEVTGRSAANPVLRREVGAFVAACRDRANALSDVWVEKVKIGTRDAVAASGSDIVESLDLDSPELREVVLAAVKADLATLLDKLPAHVDLAGDGLDLRSDATLLGLMDDARDEVVRRLVEADSSATGEGEA